MEDTLLNLRFPLKVAAIPPWGLFGWFGLLIQALGVLGLMFVYFALNE